MEDSIKNIITALLADEERAHRGFRGSKDTLDSMFI